MGDSAPVFLKHACSARQVFCSLGAFHIWVAISQEGIVWCPKFMFLRPFDSWISMTANNSSIGAWSYNRFLSFFFLLDFNLPHWPTVQPSFPLWMLLFLVGSVFPSRDLVRRSRNRIIHTGTSFVASMDRCEVDTAGIRGMEYCVG